MTNTDQTATSAKPLRSRLGFVPRFAQILCFAWSVLFALIVLAELRKAHVPGAPAWTIFLAVAVSIAVAVLFIPSIFWRLPCSARSWAWLSLVLPFAAYGFEAAQMEPSWSASAQGMREAAQHARSDAEAQNRSRAEAAEALERKQTEDRLAVAAKAEEKLQELNKRLESCFTTFGHRLPALEEPVKAALHNPRAFEHVSTVIIVPDVSHNNVQMTFRAENAFGAIRTANVRARLIAEDCSVKEVDEPVVD